MTPDESSREMIMELPKDIIHHGDTLSVLKTMPNESVNCCVTSPPYWGLRDYGVKGQIGMEKTLDEYVAKMVEIFREVRRVLRKDGTLWMNLGDTYSCSWGATSHALVGRARRMAYNCRPPQSRLNGLKSKDLCCIPWMVAIALRSDGWYLRSDIIWSKLNPMPESVTDRPTKAHEYIFLMSKNKKYYYDGGAIKERSKSEGSIHVDGNTDKMTNQKGFGTRPSKTYVTPAFRNKRSVWGVSTMPYSKAHFATFPPKLIEPCILAGCPRGGIVLDPFMGSGTTGMVAKNLLRHYIGIELNSQYIEMAEERIGKRLF